VKPLLIIVGSIPAAPPPALAGRGVELRRLPGLPDSAELDPARPTVVVAHGALLAGWAADRRAVARLTGRAALVGRASPDDPAVDHARAAHLLVALVPAGAPDAVVAEAIDRAHRHAVALAAAHRARVASAASRAALAELTRAGLALATERDPVTLMAAILTQARRITNSDGGSIYLLEGGREGHPPALHFKLAQNDSLPDLPLATSTVGVDHASLAGHAAATGHRLVIDDAALLPADGEFTINRSFDECFGYRTKSVLVIPMKSQRDEVIGVLQLVNRKRTTARLASDGDVEREVLPYDARAVGHVTALAAHAAVSLENSLLHTSIERLFDGFIAAAATAVETRDPTTSGHSQRVAVLAGRLAGALNDGYGVGACASARLTREELLALRYAALLHDFGKVGVREDLLVKAHKLHPEELAEIRQRITWLAQEARLECERAKVAALRGALADPSLAPDAAAAVAALDAAAAARVDELRSALATIVAANEAPWTDDVTRAALHALAARQLRDEAGALHPLLTPEELRHLSIARGNLDAGERGEIEAHVAHTYRFLQQIPWTPALASVPEIAYAHHERPNGRGYPRQLAGPAIPLGSRIIAVVDIYDALTAADRPYKRAVPPERAIAVMREEAAEGGLDGDLVETFVAAALHEPPVMVPDGAGLRDSGARAQIA
jgi:HD-GYP domain-containing protein (c-di-GMP phosphodiesterase class II)